MALITGGSRGLGLLMARELALQGARLAILARDPDELDLARRELTAVSPSLVRLFMERSIGACAAGGARPAGRSRPG